MQNSIKSTINNFINKFNFIHEKYNIFKKYFDKSLMSFGRKLGKIGVSANLVTVIGFIIGLFALNFLSYEYYFHALACILINRFFDILDGAIARATKSTKFGVFMDILFDYIFYGAVIFGFAFARPENALPAAFLLLGFLSVSCAMLAFAVIDYKYPSKKEEKKKSPFYLIGIFQSGEIFIALVLACILPGLFMIIAGITGIICIVKAFSLIIAGYYKFVVQDNNE